LSTPCQAPFKGLTFKGCALDRRYKILSVALCCLMWEWCGAILYLSMFETNGEGRGLSRRGFLKLSGGVAAAVFMPRWVERLLEEHYTPPSLMLHSANFELMKELAPRIKDEYTFLTYREYYRAMVEGRKFVEPPFLLSLDDASPIFMNENFGKIVNELGKFGIKGTLAVVTGDQGRWNKRYLEQLRSFANSGWELAMHGKEHLNFPSLGYKELWEEIADCHQALTAIDPSQEPTTLILPFGDYWRGRENVEIDERIPEICRELGIIWIVGIKGGKEFQGKPPYYVGRIPPAKDAKTTLAWLEGSFGQR
jgi:peptidoglycan/xylan/chitin deacetylase (PgdA/CDA1 family)